jgi:hypothetical protein
MKTLILAAAAITATVASPASAATFSLAGDFGNPVFQYGTVAGNTPSFFAASNCNDIGVSSLCYRGSDLYQVEFKRTATELLVHPGPNDGQNSFVFFTAPTAGLYTFSVTFNRGDSGDGVNIFSFGTGGLTPIGRVDGTTPTYTYAGSQYFTAGQQVGLGVDRGGANSTYFNDSTFVSGTISVPEPATWGMMMLGFGMIGYGLRSRRKVTTRVAFA